MISACARSANRRRLRRLLARIYREQLDGRRRQVAHTGTIRTATDGYRIRKAL
jgi:hypothetical protein